MKNRKNVSIARKQARQGDVLMVKVDSIPANVKAIPGNSATLALGEVTGHHHTLEAGVQGFSSEVEDNVKVTGGERVLAEFVDVKTDGAELTHQEHDAIGFESGNWEAVRQFEYTPKALQRVAD